MNNKISSIVLCSLLCGCTSFGSQSLSKETEASVASKIIEGKSTRAEVRTSFGAPSSVSFTDSGQETWRYSFQHVTPDAVNFVPIVSMFGSSMSGTSKELVVLFDKEGTVQRFSMIESPVEYKSGVFSSNSSAPSSK